MNLLGVAAQEISEEPPDMVRFEDGMIGQTVEAPSATYMGQAVRIWTVQVGPEAWRSLFKRESLN